MSKDLSTNLLYSLKKIALFKYKKRIFKNYFFIRKKKDHDLLLVLQKNFLKLSYNINHNSLNFFLGKSKIDFNLALKQLMYVRLFFRLRTACIYFLNSRSIIFPMPKKVSYLFENKNELLFILNSILWSLLNFFILIKTFIFLIKVTFSSIFSLLKNKNHSNSIFFCDIQPKFLSYKIEDQAIISWYKKNFFLDKEIKILTNCYIDQKKINNDLSLSNDKLIPKIDNLWKILLFFFNSFSFVLFSLFQLILTKWEYAFISKEVVKTLIFKNTNSNSLCKEYLFTNYVFFYRPLWSYIAEERGSKIILIFLSSMSATKSLQLYPWRLLSWSNYYIWDKLQLNLIQKYNNTKFNYKLFNYIPAFDSVDRDYLMPKADICIFDDPPMDIVNTVQSGLIDTVYNEKNCFYFLEDIFQICQKNNLKVLYKVKKIHHKIRRGYMKRIEVYKNKYQNVEFVPENLSPSHLINNSKLTISFPFTSTAQIANYFKKYSIYYLPENISHIQDKLSNDTLLLRSKLELENFIKKIFLKNSQ
jgi:hypothetical protein